MVVERVATADGNSSQWTTDGTSSKTGASLTKSQTSMVSVASSGVDGSGDESTAWHGLNKLGYGAVLGEKVHCFWVVVGWLIKMDSSTRI